MKYHEQNIALLVSYDWIDMSNYLRLHVPPLKKNKNISVKPGLSQAVDSSDILT